MRLLFLIILTLLSLNTVGQNQIQIKKIFFFGPGKYSLSYTQKLQLDSIVENIKERNYQVFLSGHADTIGNEKLNLKISKRRTLSVSRYLLKNGIDQSKVENKYLGEQNPIFSNSTTHERVKNRCVEIKIILPQNQIALIEKEEAKVFPQRKKFESDTVIYCKKGTQIEIMAETFYPRKISEIDFDVTEIYSLCDMLNNNTVTRTNNGDCLTSAGMLFVKPTLAGVEVQPNKGTFVKIKMPTKGGTIDKAMKLYGGVKNNNGQLEWKNLEPEVSYEEAGNQFYVFKVDTLSSFNLDKPLGIVCKKDGHKIRLPKQLKNATICQTYPDEKYLSIAEKLSERKFTLDKVIKEKKPVVTIIAYDKLNYPFIAKGPLYELKYRKYRDMYVVNRRYFKRAANEPDSKKSHNDYLCKFMEN